jgi:hypothetical protein
LQKSVTNGCTPTKASQTNWKITRARREFGRSYDSRSPYSSRIVQRNKDSGGTAPAHQETGEDAHFQSCAGPSLLGVKERGGAVLVGLVGDPLIIDSSPGAAWLI